MRTVTVEVTQRDIDRGEVQSCNECPIALAIKRLFPNAERMEVDGIQISWREADRFYSATTPDEASDFIDLFDGEDAVEPFTFELEVYDQ